MNNDHFCAGLCHEIGTKVVATREYEPMKNPTWAEFILDLIISKDITRDGYYMTWYTALRKNGKGIADSMIGTLFQVTFTDSGYRIEPGPKPRVSSTRLTTWPPKSKGS